MEQSMKLMILVLTFMSLVAHGMAYWCTRQKAETFTHEVTSIQKCNQTYEDNCSFFTWDKCTYSELVDCPFKKNITVTRYLTVEECCPGYKLDPINNITCIPTAERTYHAKGEQGTNNDVTASGAEGERERERGHNSQVTISAPKQAWPVVGTESENAFSYNGHTRHGENTGHLASMDDKEDLLFGLSYGAYAGIICTLLFLFCVFILIMLHLRKKSQKEKAKERKADHVEMETTQKMLNAQA